MVFRPLAGPEELGLFCRLSYSLDHELADDLAQGRRRPSWMWVAVREGRVLARVAWWSGRGGDTPLALDFFDLDDTLPEPERSGIGRELFVRAAEAVLPEDVGTWPEYSRYVPADWRENDAARDAVEARMRILESAGARLLVERLRLEWRPGARVAEPSGRLVFRPVADREDLLALMTPVMEGTVDAHGLADIASGLDFRQAAELHYDDELAHFTSPRSWWRIAELADGGGPVGFVVPARNNYHPIIAYVGVLPVHRGNGYIHEILAEGTRVLAAEDVPRIRAATDLGNVPMAEAFARAGYVNFERALNMSWGLPG
ncbi:GNAT family N-acetyltransferase [Streptomyces candidus]|uniref:GNAT family N-acetyltransferase n=1 Tax=Streptomyces candidus TaxID=67283 RepID=UPI00161FBAD4|nr:GNAT family N-acetyltransferase [Streptomyces candidus]